MHRGNRVSLPSESEARGFNSLNNNLMAAMRSRSRLNEMRGRAFDTLERVALDCELEDVKSEGERASDPDPITQADLEQ